MVVHAVEIAVVESTMIEYEFIMKDETSKFQQKLPREDSPEHQEKQKKVLADWQGGSPPTSRDVWREDLKRGQPLTTALPWNTEMRGEREPSDAPTDYNTLVEQKSPLVSGLSEKEFHTKYGYNEELGAWQIKNRPADPLGKLQKFIDLYKKKDGDDEEGQELPADQFFDDPDKVNPKDLSPEEQEEIRRALAEIPTPPQRKIPYDEVPEDNKSQEIPDAFKDAFPDEEGDPPPMAKMLFKAFGINNGKE